jgi:hypothetical protein
LVNCAAVQFVPATVATAVNDCPGDNVAVVGVTLTP